MKTSHGSNPTVGGQHCKLCPSSPSSLVFASIEQAQDTSSLENRKNKSFPCWGALPLFFFFLAIQLFYAIACVCACMYI
ncbi:hypothetical protein OIU84_004934 [Salix udensis]|uniref:Uncharacterized protein n=1 Tax=Salix udensis TaxID=889485 RepID=A0AAD6K3H8_9ROSI|nr:hypothetical protein OIU84_004934 [Salix udensis]